MVRFHSGQKPMTTIDERIYDEVFFSIDGEFDGSHPPKHSMLSIGAVAFNLRDGILGEFSRNMFPLMGGRPQPSSVAGARMAWLESIGLPSGHTMDKRVWDDFWSKWPEAWEAVNTDQVVPALAMKEFGDWYMEMCLDRGNVSLRNGVLIEYPGGIDYFWLHWYMMEFMDHDPFGHSRAMSMKSYAAAATRGPFCHSTNRNLPKRWFASKLPHPHIAVDDARGQAHWAIRMMCEHLEIPCPLD